MGRGATKACENPFYQARLRATKYDKSFLSRERASEVLDMSLSALADAETGKSKVMPVDKAVLLADKYGAPELLNYYCLHECPIGSRRALSYDLVDIERATVKITQILRKETVQWIKHGLQDIAMDGEVGDDEVGALDEIIESLRTVSKTISELEVIRDKVKKEKEWERNERKGCNAY